MNSVEVGSNRATYSLDQNFNNEIVTPTYPNHLTPRMQGDVCHHCKKQGHWARYCPFKTPNKSQSSPHIEAFDLPVFQCPCGRGACLVQVSQTQKNPGRKFYSCPGRLSGCGFFKWCDEALSPQSKTPMCPCGAGRCSINIQTSGQHKGRRYFACRVRQGHGACKFFQWEDNQLDTTINQHVDEREHENSQSTWNGQQAINTVNSGVSGGGDSSFDHPKRMKLHSSIINNIQHASNFMEVPEPSEKGKVQLMESREHEESSTITRDNGLLQVVAPRNDSFVSDLTTEDLVMEEAELSIPVMEKALRDFRLTSQAEIHRRQTEFLRQISASGDTPGGGIVCQILGLHVMGWWGRIAFSPSRCLKSLPPKPFFCGVFPSCDPIVIPQGTDMLNFEGSTFLPRSPNAESDKLAVQTPGNDAQFSRAVIWEAPGRNNIPLNVVEDRDITGSISEEFEQVAKCVQNKLVALVESMDDPLGHESILKEAKTVFSNLDRLSIHFRMVYEHVTEYIGCASSVAQIKRSICSNDVSSQRLSEQYNHERIRLENISNLHAEATAAVKASDKRLESLRKEASRLKDKLLEIENELSCCEGKALELETRVFDISNDKVECESSLQAASEELAEALKVRKQEEEMLCAADAELEKVRIKLHG